MADWYFCQCDIARERAMEDFADKLLMQLSDANKRSDHHDVTLDGSLTTYQKFESDTTDEISGTNLGHPTPPTKCIDPVEKNGEEIIRRENCFDLQLYCKQEINDISGNNGHNNDEDKNDRDEKNILSKE